MILTIAIPTPLRRLFDYLPPENLQIDETQLLPGMRVKVPFGSRKLVGLIVGTKVSSDQPLTRLKPIEALIDQTPLVPESLLNLFLWAADYYQHPPGDALFSTLPVLLRKGEAIPDLLTEHWQLTTRGLGLGDASLQRAKKQKGLTDLLRNNGTITPDTAIEAGFSRQIFNQLADKQLAERIMLDARPESSQPLLANPALALRKEQQAALNSIRPHKYSTTLLFGDTGSGKTEVYLQAIEQALARGLQALVLIPEINLTPQTLSRFRHRFNCRIQTIHSKLTNHQRLQAWTEARAGITKIVIGTRSAIFTPMPNLGIIILDEEHDASFKQQEGFRYSARDVAVMRASKAKIPVILGSATPSLESLYNCQKHRYKLVELKERTQQRTPQWVLVDLKGTELQGGLASATIAAIRKHLADNNQVLLFLNRRGYAPVMLCHLCGWQARCGHCSTTMTAHLGSKRLICHHCEKQLGVPRQCPDCNSNHLLYSGQGTERCEETLNNLFPDTNVIRVDRDSTRKKDSMETVISHIHSDQPCILIGTQMLAKGHHFPSVTLAVLLDVDGGLFSTDFRAIEKTAQLIIQVAGRAGRGAKPGEIYLQSHYCEHPVIADLVKGDYRAIAQGLMAERQVLQLPPISHLAYFRCDALNPGEGQKFLDEVRYRAERLMPPSNRFNYLGPLPGAIEKRRDHYRFTLLINAVNRSQLAQGLKVLCQQLEKETKYRNLKWSLDVDPIDMG